MATVKATANQTDAERTWLQRSGNQVRRQGSGPTAAGSEANSVNINKTTGGSMARSYEIKHTEDGWRMAVTEDGIEIAGAAAGDTDEDYEFLLEQAEAICAFD